MCRFLSGISKFNMKRISEFFSVVPAPKRPAIEETLSDLPSHVETQSRGKAVYPEVVKGDSSSASGKHKTGYDKHWEKTFPWLEYTEDLGSSGGMFCSLCRKHETSTLSKSELHVWVSKPYKLMRRDKVVQHSKSERHQTALERERLAAEASTVGGISQGFEQVISLQRKAVLGALKIVYWLAKLVSNSLT